MPSHTWPRFARAHEEDEELSGQRIGCLTLASANLFPVRLALRPNTTLAHTAQNEEAIAWQLDVQRWRMDDKLHPVDHSPELSQAC